MPSDWTFTNLDREIALELQKSFLPLRMFDAHAHLYPVIDDGAGPSVMNTGPRVVTREVWERQLAQQVGAARCSGGLFFPDPIVQPEQVDSINDFIVEQVAGAKHSRCLIVIYPDYSQKQALRYLENGPVAGFKVYHTFSPVKPTFEAPIDAFIPEWAWELADSRSLIILLHMVRHRALADPDNQRYIRDRCRRYPRAKLVLAHAARGFHAPNTVQGLPAIRDLENVWFDLSGVCEPEALAAILTEFGPRRLMWGTDFPVSEIRGKCVTVGDGFAWLQSDTVQWEKLSPACQPTLVGLESLRALRAAVDQLGLNADDVQDICADNALRLLGMCAEPAAQTQDLYRHAKERIPGGTQLLSKRPEMMAPNQWPPYFREARGCEVWDLDGRHYFDMSTNGIGACLLGFRDPDVTRAVRRRLELGSMCTLNPPEEVALADVLCNLHPWAEQARFTRTGGESMAVAVRIARATTKRSLVAICGYHGWHDWYLAANLGDNDALKGHLLPGLDPEGVPVELRGTNLPFRYNNREDLQAILDRHGDRLAAVVMEPCRYAPPEPGFLEFVRDGVHRCGGLLILDEITIGWRLRLGGAHLGFGVNPDMAVLAKALGNGHPMGAVIGTAAAMAGAQESFISSTYWTEGIGPTAALATVDKMQRIDVPAHIARVGTAVVGHWKAAADRHGLAVIAGDGFPCLAHFRFDDPLEPQLRTLYTQLMLERGFLANCMIYPTLAHTDEAVTRYGAAIDEVFGELASAMKTGDVEKRLKGPVAHGGFKRLT